MTSAAAGLVLSVSVATVGHAEHGVVKTTQLVDSQLVSYRPATEVAGRLAIAGSDTMRPLLAKIASEFLVIHPDVKIAIEGGGSESGIHEFLIGYSQQRRGEKSRQGHDGAAMATILASSRQLTDAEKRKFTARFGYEPIELPIAMDAVAVYVHQSNPIAGLTLAQLDALYSAERRRGAQPIETWGQLGLADEWKDEVIHLHGRDAKSGTRRFFQQQVMLNADFKDNVLDQKGAASELLAIARDPSAIGYAGVIGYETSLVRMVPLAQQPGSPFVAPTSESIRDGSYPLRRDLYLYANVPVKGGASGLLSEFLRYVNSRDGQVAVAKAKFYPVTMAQVEKNLQRLGDLIKIAAVE
ncbi:PstS family phosphate ABC transporter substrate-binding protein [Candidatus Nitrospira bockiana]